MATIKVLFFGATAETTGKREIELSLDESATSKDVLARIVFDFPNLPKNLLFSVNQEYCKGDEIIKDGDELAVFTPVSGG